MVRAAEVTSKLLETDDAGLGRRAQGRVFIYRTLTVLGAALMPLYGCLFYLDGTETYDPLWARLLVSGLLAALFGASYVSTAVRRRYVELSWGALFLITGWVTALAVWNGFSGGYSVAVLFTCALFSGIIGLGARSLTPVLGFQAYGILLAAGGLQMIPSPETGQAVLLGSMTIIALFEAVATRWALSAQRRLEARKEEAKEASRMKSAMLANMSHEIRTPLTSVIGFAEAIGEDEAAAGRFAPRIEKNGRRLLETLNTVLTLSKLEAGRMELEETTVDLASQAEVVASELRSRADEGEIGLQVRTNGSATYARADEGGVQIVLQNLLSNAIKYTESGRVEVRAFQENGHAAIEVEDTGIGMEPEVTGKLFEPFRQASEGLGREYEGTGVGLAVTKKAVKEMNGSIEVETQEGEGSCFTVRFPRAEKDGEVGK